MIITLKINSIYLKEQYRPTQCCIKLTKRFKRIKIKAKNLKLEAFALSLKTNLNLKF